MIASLLRAALAAVFVLAAAPVWADAGNMRFVYVAHGKPPVPWWTVLKNGVDSAAEELGVEVEFRAPESFDMAAMSALIDEAVASDPDGIVVTIPDRQGLADAIRAAVASGVPIVSVNSGSEAFAELGVPIHVGQPEYEAGLAAGKRMRDEGAASAACLNQEGGNIAGMQRCQGFKDGFGDGVEEVALPYDEQGVRAIVSDYLQSRPDIEGALILGPTASAPVVEIVGEAGRLGDIVLGTFDYTPAVLDHIAAGNIAFAVDQQPYLQGYLPVFFLSKYAQYGVLPTGIIGTGPSFISKDNVDQVRALSAQNIR